MASFSDIAATATQFITGTAQAVQGVNNVVGAVSGRAAPAPSLTQLQTSSYYVNGAGAIVPRLATSAGPPVVATPPTSLPTSFFVVAAVGILGLVLFFVLRHK